MSERAARPLSWFEIVRLGLVQTALGAIVVLTTSTMNRIMVVEMMLPAMVPGALVAFHHAIQLSRPRWGYGSDVGGRRTPWIVGGMIVLALGGVAASVATTWMGEHYIAGLALGVLAFTMIGVGVGASGTSLLVLLAKRVAPSRRAPAATIVWVMMIAGFVVTATTAGHFLDPYSAERLITVTSCVALGAVILTLVAVRNVERAAEGAAAADDPAAEADADAAAKVPFAEAFRQVWQEADARWFTIFVFVSMLAYSAQDLILEPFAGLAFGFTPGESTKLAGVQNGGVLIGMALVGVVAGGWTKMRAGSLKTWTIGGCLASAAALFCLTVAGFVAPAWPLRGTVFCLGVANGAFAVAAIALMMALVDAGRERREGVRMGLWGAAQAIAFGVGGFLGAVSVDLVRHLIGTPVVAYALVFAGEGLMFVIAAVLAVGIGQPQRADAAAAESDEVDMAASGAGAVAGYGGE